MLAILRSEHYNERRSVGDSRRNQRSPSTLGGILKRRREQLGLSTREAARRIGISASYIVALEQGHNPSTGRAPLPSVPILAAIARILDVDLTTLLEAAGSPGSAAAHLLLYQTGPGYDAPFAAARRLFAGQVDGWIEIVDPRRSGSEAPADDVLIRKRGPLAWARSGSHTFDGTRALAALSAVVSAAPRLKLRRRLGIIFGANSAALRSIDNPSALLEGERTWEHDVGTTLGVALDAEPPVSVCVYREPDIQEVAGRLDPLATVLTLVHTHRSVAVQDSSGTVTTGPAAIETILAPVRPAGVSSKTWESLTRAAALGFGREATARRVDREQDTRAVP